DEIVKARRAAGLPPAEAGKLSVQCGGVVMEVDAGWSPSALVTGGALFVDIIIIMCGWSEIIGLFTRLSLSDGTCTISELWLVCLCLCVSGMCV
ncbi:MAG: hypothetical protein P4L40_23175, partial [Terracidiphilus sp.]|nr:hypothetical protein [Terracidiphilus sp.]